jgi:hypothetical protein
MFRHHSGGSYATTGLPPWRRSGQLRNTKNQLDFSAILNTGASLQFDHIAVSYTLHYDVHG